MGGCRPALSVRPEGSSAPSCSGRSANHSPLAASLYVAQVSRSISPAAKSGTTIDRDATPVRSDFGASLKHAESAGSLVHSDGLEPD